MPNVVSLGGFETWAPIAEIIHIRAGKQLGTSGDRRKCPIKIGLAKETSVGRVGEILFIREFAGVDDAFVADFNDIITSVIYGLLGRYSAGEIAVTDILPILDRSVYHLTRGY